MSENRGRRSKLRGLLELVRPELPFGAGICVVMGQIVALGSVPPPHRMLLGFAWAFFLSAPSLVLNDYFDIEVDKVNAPHRPLPSGRVSRADTIAVAAGTTAVGFLVSWFIGLSAALLYGTFWAIGFLYNWRGKQLGLFGNMLVSSSVGVTFVFGGLMVGHPWSPIVWVLSLMAFSINLGLEVAADAIDIEGDRKRNVRSVAATRGRGFSLLLARSLFLVAILLSLVPVLGGWLGLSYLIMILFTDAMIIVFSTRLHRSTTPGEGRRALRGLYLCVTLGMLAFVIGQLVS